MDGFEAFEHLFVGQDPLAIARHVRVLETIDFHAGRYWPLEVALWDIVGKVAGLPVATLFGGAADALPVYASCGMLLPAAARAESALRLRAEGFRALKIRIDPRRLEEGMAAVAATRDAVGDSMAIMVDLNQGWRMAGDTSAVARPGRAPARSPGGWPSTTCCGWRSRSPARTCAAWRRCEPRRPGSGSPGGEMTRTFGEQLAALDADAFDVHQSDVVLAAGMSRTRTLAELALARNRWFTPHTWTNGIGLLANLAVSAGVGGGPFLEFPYDPPGWTPERRDFMLAEPIRPDADGLLHVPAVPGLGIALDEAAHRAVRGMTTAPRADRRGLAGPRGRRRTRGPSCSSTVGSCRRPPGETFDDIAGRDGSRIASVADGGLEDVDRAVAAARRVVRRPPLVGPDAGRPQAGPAHAGRPRPRAPRGAGPARVARRRQADPRHAGRRRAELREHAPVVRRDDRQDVRRGRADRARRALDGDARADRRRRAPSCPGTTR